MKEKTSGIKNFMTETFLANKWGKAPKGLIYKFFDTIKSVYAKIDANITESNDLIKQRDELLPLLMNGQATVNYDLAYQTSFFFLNAIVRSIACSCMDFISLVRFISSRNNAFTLFSAV